MEFVEAGSGADGGEEAVLEEGIFHHVAAEGHFSVLESWAEYEPQQALTAALQLSSADGARESAVNSVLGQFLAANPEDFTQLVAQMPAGFRAELTQRKHAFRDGKAPLAAQR